MDYIKKLIRRWKLKDLPYHTILTVQDKVDLLNIWTTHQKLILKFEQAQMIVAIKNDTCLKSRDDIALMQKYVKYLSKGMSNLKKIDDKDRKGELIRQLKL